MLTLAKLAREPGTEPDHSRVIDQAVWRIWELVRDNRDSLDSERITAEIRKLLDLATAELQAELTTAENGRKAMVARCRNLRRKVNRAEGK